MDFNNDGLDDLILGERDGYVTYYRRLSNGSLTSEGRIQAGNIDLDVDGNSAPCVFDWNNDGLLDLVIGRDFTAGGSIRLFLNSGTPSKAVFSTYTPVMRGSSPITWSRSVPHMRDMDGDGLVDLMVAEDRGRTFYLRNEGAVGAPVFKTSSRVTVNGSQFAWPSGQTDGTIYIDDWNEDGTLDMLQGNYVKNLWVFLGNPVDVWENTNTVFNSGMSVTLLSNPVNTSLKYSVFTDRPVALSVSLWDMDGRVVEEWNLGTLQGASEHVHALLDLPNGVYSMVLSAGNEMSYRQVAVIK